MKIVCDACQAKYSISDDKVQGKVFKIRCKKCSNIIVVRGGAQASEPAPAPAEKDTRVYDYGYEGGGAAGGGDEAVWHLVINQDQVGPMTAGEVQQKFASGEVDAETFAWREGFADWLPLSQVDAFAAFVASGSTTTASSGGGGQAAVAAMFGGGDDAGGTARSDPGDLFAAASASSSKSRPSDDDDGNDLFGSKPAAASAASAGAAASTKLRGERNENSVLFSLNNLAQLASNSPAPAPAASSSSSAGHATGAAGGEGSGLIDIRSMASAYLGGSAGGAAKPTATAGIGSIDDLPVFGGGGFSEPAVIMPTVSRSNNNKVLYVMIGAVGLLAIAAVIMVVILLKGNKNPQVAAADTKADTDKGDKDKDKDTKPDKAATADDKTDTAAAGSAAPQGSATPTETATTGTATVAAADKTPAAKQPAAAPAPATHTAATHTESHPATHEHVAQASPRAPTGGTQPPAPKADKADSGGGGCDEVSCVLNNYDGACCQKFRKGKAAGGGGGGAPAGGGGGNSNLPDLDRSIISSAIGAVKGRAMACGDKSSAKGMVKVHVKVDPSGHISSVSVSQTPDPALGACVAAAVGRASFPKTSNGGSFSYPFPF